LSACNHDVQGSSAQCQWQMWLRVGVSQTLPKLRLQLGDCTLDLLSRSMSCPVSRSLTVSRVLQPTTSRILLQSRRPPIESSQGRSAQAMYVVTCIPVRLLCGDTLHMLFDRRNRTPRSWFPEKHRKRLAFTNLAVLSEYSASIPQTSPTI
jgi:hypothetical protein